MSDEGSLADVLTQEIPEQLDIEQPAAEETVDAPVEDQVEEKTPDDETPEQEPAPTVETESKTVPIEALKDERTKRQELQARLDAIENPPEQTDATDPNDAFWKDPVGTVGQLVSSVELRVLQQLAARSEAAARTRHDDYDEKLAAFVAAANDNPALAKKMAQHHDPGEYAYITGRDLLALEGSGSLNELVSQKDQEIANLKAELAKLSGSKAAAEDVPESLSSRQTKGGQDVTEDDSLDAVLSG